MVKKVEIGEVVLSTMGRDQEHYFIVSAVEEEFVYLIDGDLRRIEKPKRKKARHIKPTRIIVESIRQKLLKQENILNAEVRKQLKKVLKENELNG